MSTSSTYKVPASVLKAICDYLGRRPASETAKLLNLVDTLREGQDAARKLVPPAYREFFERMLDPHECCTDDAPVAA